MNRISTLAILLASSALTAAPALAQQAAAPASSGSGNAIGEIVVTASRVQTTAQKTPIALTVYSGQQLAQQSVHSVQALATIDPSVNVVSSTGAAYVAVRGIASTDVTEIGDPAVSIARDGFFTNRSFTIADSLYDLQRVEVLKGPQGTLFGRNSTGGLISIVTNKPDNTFGGYVSADVGDYSAVSTEAALNLPVNDKLQLRVSGFQAYHDGYRDLTGINLRGDDEGAASGRIQAAFEPFDGFKGLVTYQHDFTKDRGDVAEDGPIGQVISFGSAKSFPNWQPTENRVVEDRVRWEFSYDKLPLGLTLTYAGGYDTAHWNHQLDATGPGGPNQTFIQSEQPDTWNQEVRIATRQDQRLTFQGGYFHFSEVNNLDSGEFETGGPYVGNYLIHFNYNVHTSSDAVFGQAGYSITDNLKLTVGGRYTWDQKQRVGDAVLNLQIASGGYLPPIIVTTPGNGQLNESQPTYHVGLDWTPTNHNLLYAKYDTGYKAGGFNSNGSHPSVPYGPETVKAWEVGSKNRFFDRKLELNLDAFYQTYDGYQASQTTSALSGSSGVFNVGSATIYGAEAEAVAILDPIGKFDMNFTALHAHFDNGIPDVVRGDNAATPADISGNALPNAPDFVISAGFEHAFDLGPGTVTARIQGKDSSAFYFTVFNDPDTRQKAYATGDIMVRYNPHGANWELEAYVRNFTDEVVLVNAARNYNSNWNTYEFAPPRTYGVRAKYSF